MSDNLEILIFEHINRVVPKPEDLLFTRKKGSSKKEADFRDIFKMDSKVSVLQSLWSLLTPSFLLHKFLQ